jgi:hypothetical protein
MKFDTPVIKARIEPDMMGCDCLLMLNDKDYAKMEYGEDCNAHITIIADVRSYKQLGLYWACCKLVADNTDDVNLNTSEKVDEQCKIKARLVESWLYYTNEKTGEQCLNIKTGSIAFCNMSSLEASGYFTDAFNTMSGFLGISADELISAAKRKMRGHLI